MAGCRKNLVPLLEENLEASATAPLLCDEAAACADEKLSLEQPTYSHNQQQQQNARGGDIESILSGNLASEKLSLRFSKDTDDFQENKEARKNSKVSVNKNASNMMASVEIIENASLKSHASSNKSSNKTRESSAAGKARRSFPSILNSENSRLSIITFLNNITAAPAPTEKQRPLRRVQNVVSSDGSSVYRSVEHLGSTSKQKMIARGQRLILGEDDPYTVVNIPASIEHKTGNANVENCDVRSHDSFFSMSSANGGVGETNSQLGPPNADHQECNICCSFQLATNFPALTNCSHRVCKSCLLKYLSIEIMESRTDIACPECAQSINPNDIYKLLATDNAYLLGRYEWFSLRRLLMSEPDVRWCPAPDCSYGVIAGDCSKCPQLFCERPGCDTSFCYNCKGYWHEGITCEQMARQAMDEMIASFEASRRARRTNPPFAGPSFINTGDGTRHTNLDDVESIGIDPKANDGEIKLCPKCNVLIMKLNDGSCNHISCTMCGTEFCWLCLKQINELHYLSPTGCTFWGKRPWSRKKKLLWQIGTLIGAPVGIALTAGLAIPGIIIGVPIFVGRKAYQRFSNLSRGKRNTITALSVLGSLLVSPVLAVMAVGIGVPIMLAYVYGVIPLSLCRNGACGGGGGGADASVTDDDLSEIYPYGEEVLESGNINAEQIDLLTASHRKNNAPGSSRKEHRSRTRPTPFDLVGEKPTSVAKGGSDASHHRAVTILSRQKATTPQVKAGGGAHSSSIKTGTGPGNVASGKLSSVSSGKKPPIVDRKLTTSPPPGSIGSGESAYTVKHNQQRQVRRPSAPGGNRRLSSPSALKPGSGSVRATATCEGVEKGHAYTGVRKAIHYGAAGSQQQQLNHHRRQSNESSGITSLGAGNTEDASIRAIAGSQYACDARSVYTLGRGVDLEAVSYNEDTASTIACCGGVPERRSLSGGGSFKAVGSVLSHGALVKSNGVGGGGGEITAGSPAASITRPRSSMSRSPSAHLHHQHGMLSSSYSCNFGGGGSGAGVENDPLPDNSGTNETPKPGGKNNDGQKQKETSSAFRRFFNSVFSSRNQHHN